MRKCSKLKITFCVKGLAIIKSFFEQPAAAIHFFAYWNSATAYNRLQNSEKRKDKWARPYLKWNAMEITR